MALSPSSAYYVMIVPGTTVVTTTSFPTASILPLGWAHTGESIVGAGTPDTVIDGKTYFLSVPPATILTTIKFGIQQTPFSDNKMNNAISVAITSPEPLTINTADTFTKGGAAILSGRDTNGGVIVYYTIKTLPANGTLYLGTTAVTSLLQVDSLTSTEVATLAYLPSAAALIQAEDEFTYYVIDNAPSRSADSRYRIPFTIPLPIKLVDFKVSNINNSVALDWQTASEKNNHLFKIEKSTNGKDWDEIGFEYSKASDGNSRALLSYQYIDQLPSLGKNYYRLKQVDFNNQFEYSNVLSVHVAVQTTIRVLPNPTQNKINIKGLEGRERISIFDATGKNILSINATNDATMEISLASLNPGNYYIRIVNFDGTISLQQTIIKL